jgi:hypothetical protein
MAVTPKYTPGERVTRARAIRLKCLDCCCGQQAEVRRCTLKTCPLWTYRLGKEEKEGAESDDET